MRVGGGGGDKFRERDLPVTICSSGFFLSFFLNTKSPKALDKARLPARRDQKEIHI